MNILFIFKMKILMFIIWSYKPLPPPPLLMLAFESRMVSIYRTGSSIFLEHTSFWCPFLKSQLTTHHLNIGVRLRQVI